MKKPLSLSQAALISAVLSFFLGLLVLGFPFLLGFGACYAFSYLGLCDTNVVLYGFALAMGVFTIIGTVGGVIAFVVWRAIPTAMQLLLVVLLFVAGLLLLQPELDVVALLGLLFTLKGVPKTPLRLPR